MRIKAKPHDKRSKLLCMQGMNTHINSQKECALCNVKSTTKEKKKNIKPTQNHKYSSI